MSFKQSSYGLGLHQTKQDWQGRNQCYLDTLNFRFFDMADSWKFETLHDTPWHFIPLKQYQHHCISTLAILHWSY